MDAIGSGFEYRRADGRDVDALVDLRIDFMRLVKDIGPEDEARWRSELCSRFESELASGAMVAWICLEEGRVVATSGLANPRDARIRRELGLLPGEALIFNMFTRPECRRRGLASELLRRSIEEARALGAVALRLRPTEDGRPLYSRFGFVDSGEDMLLAL
jgi:GNAT superfamily N-acetyltransferase